MARVRHVRGLFRPALEQWGGAEALVGTKEGGLGVAFRENGPSGFLAPDRPERKRGYTRGFSAGGVSWYTACGLIEPGASFGASATRSVRQFTSGPAVSHVEDVPTTKSAESKADEEGSISSSSTRPRGSSLISADLCAPAISLEYSGAPRVTSTAPADAGLLKKAVLFLGGYYSKQSAYMRAAKELNACVKEQALDPDVLVALDIPADSFQHRHAMLCLHVWMVLKRLRLEGKAGKKISQVMYDEFQDEVEHMVRAAGVQVRLGKHLSELEKQFYGSCTAYDRAMGREAREGLETALWRNVFQGEVGKEAASSRLAKYVQRGVASLSKTPSEAVLEGRISFR